MGCVQCSRRGERGFPEKLEEKADNELRRLVCRGSVAAAEVVVSQQIKSVELNLGGNSLPCEGERALGAALATEACVVEALRLRHCQLGVGRIRPAENLAALSDGLSKNSTVTTLDLRNNDLDDAALVNLASALRANDTIQHINLEQNKFGTRTHAGYCALGEALLVNRSISQIRMGRNGTRGLEAFLRNVVHSPSLKALYLTVDDIDSRRTVVTPRAVRADTQQFAGPTTRPFPPATTAALRDLARQRPDLVLAYNDALGLTYLNSPASRDQGADEQDIRSSPTTPASHSWLVDSA